MKSHLEYKLVLLPGLDGTGLLFQPLQDELKNNDSLQVIRYPTNLKLNYDDLAELVKTELPTSEKFILFAESFSGPVAARLVDSPGLVAIIFCASFLTPPRPRILSLLRFVPIASLLRITCPSLLLRLLLLGHRCPNRTIELFRSSIKNVKPEVLAFRLSLLSEIDDLLKVSKSELPFCYLLPSNDMLVSSRCSKLMKQSLKHFEIKQVEGHHLLAQSSPELTSKAICEFAESLSN